MSNNKQPTGSLDPKTVRSRFESDIGPRYLELVTSCLNWADESGMHMLSKQALPDAVKLPSFQKICEIHEELKMKRKAECVPGFLLGLVDCGYGLAFMIPYVYITKVVPPPNYRGLCLVLLGNSENLPKVFKALNLFPPDCE